MAVVIGQLEVHDPATGELIETLPVDGEPEAVGLVSAAHAAQDEWVRVHPDARGARLRAAVARIREHAEDLAVLQTRECGKPLAESRGGVEAAARAIEQAAELAPLRSGPVLNGAWGSLDMTVREPRGVGVALLPWNDPLAIAGNAIGAFLATGNGLVVKPSERTPLSTMRMIDLIGEELPAGLLAGAVGDGRLGAALASDPAVAVVMHVGSVATGYAVAAACAQRLAKAILELGGKDPLIVDRGVDPEWAAGQAASGAFANAGQVCTSVERIYVHRDIADDFVEALAERARGHRPGPGTDPSSTMGPLIDDVQRDIVRGHVEEALSGGARAVAGGSAVAGPGSFHEPTVLVGVGRSTRIMTEETMGPVAAVAVVETFDEALAAAADSALGLAATVLTTSQGNAQRAWRELPVGTVKVNAVWGGAPGGSAEPRGVSGLGLGYGPGLLDEVTAPKVVHMTPAPSA